MQAVGGDVSGGRPPGAQQALEQATTVSNTWVETVRGGSVVGHQGPAGRGQWPPGVRTALPEQPRGFPGPGSPSSHSRSLVLTHTQGFDSAFTGNHESGWHIKDEHRYTGLC